MNPVVRFNRDVINGWLAADAFSLAASVAYYAIFSIAPLLLLSIHLASFFIDRTSATEGLSAELISLIGPAGSDAIKQMLDAAGTARPEGWAGVFAFVVLLFAATGFVGSLQDALDRIWEAPPRPEGFWALIRTKLFSFSLILAAAFLLLISLVLATAMTAVAGRLSGAFGLSDEIVWLVIAGSNFALSVLVFAAIFKYVPRTPVTWTAALAGAAFAAVLFALGRVALAWYLGREAQASAYGAATSLVLILVWIYYSAQILFLGAQFSQSIQEKRWNYLTEKADTTLVIATDKTAQDLAALAFIGLVLAITIPRFDSRRSIMSPGLLNAFHALIGGLKPR